MSPAVLLMTVLAGLAGWVAGQAAGASVRPWFTALVAGAVALEVAVVRPAVESVSGGGVSGAALRLWRRGELLALIVGVKAMHVVTSLPGSLDELARFPRGLADAETVTGWLLGLAVWALVNGTIDDLEAIERGVEQGRGSVARIRARVTATSVIVIAVSAFATVGVGGLLDLDRRASGEIPLAGVLFVVTALVGLSRFALRASAGRWVRDGASIDPDVADRWRRMAVMVVGAALGVGVVVPLLTRSVTSLPLAAITRAGGIGDWLVRTVEGIGGLDAPEAGAGGEQPPPVEPEPLPDPTTPDWFGELVMWLFVGMVFAWVVVRAGRTRALRDMPEGASPPWGTILLEAARVLWATVVGIVRAILGLLRDAGSAVAGRLGRRPPTPAGAAAVPAGPALPDDPVRARIYLAHRRFVRAAGGRFGRRRPPETPREFAGRVREVAPPQVDVVTGAYEAARYSDHRMSGADAGRAEAAADAVVERLSEPWSEDPTHHG